MQELLDTFRGSLLREEQTAFIENHLLNADDDLLSSFLTLLKNEDLDLLLYGFLREYKNSSPRFESMRAELHKNFVLEKARQFYQLEELKEILQCFPDSTLLLKGLSLCHYLEKDIYKRSVDIDLLVTKNHQKSAIQKALQLGYEMTKRYYAYGEYSFEKGKHLYIDLHYDLSVSAPLMRIFDINQEELFLKKTNVAFQQTMIPTLNKETTLLYLCIHLVINHQMNGFMLLYEITLFLSLHSKSLCFDNLINTSNRFKLNQILYIALAIVGFHAKVGWCGRELFEKLRADTSNVHRMDQYLSNYCVQQNALVNRNRMDREFRRLFTDNFTSKIRYGTGLMNFFLKGAWLRINDKID
ncbi:nucleotidyltransferase family protein [Fulvivirgaceae bacterium BMA10]|uniref:Nucleotidyltransferase family protein n=1 Tax=Splendidivirga corallicola TaxID=3051826 RepID=A0ABT8KLK6_9BACT|nr:nucleotidyltransferase family protein [Fulvivirgaceae bacterium BMA10]